MPLSNAEAAFRRYQEKKAEMIRNKRKIPLIMLKRLLRPVLRLVLFAQRKFVGFRVELMHITKKRNRSPVIFAVTHMGKWDFEIVNEQIPQQCYVVASDFVNSYRKISGYFMAANGVIWVDGHNSEDRHNTKEMMKKVISQGGNILIFPEGAWNLHECEIVRDIAYGTAEVAICMGTEIIPVAVEQYGKRFVIHMGETLHPADFNCDKEMLTQVLRDTLASLKWEIWEREGVQRRETIPADYWRDFIAWQCGEWKGYSMREQMFTFIPKNKREYWSVQQDLRTGYLPEWYKIMLKEER